MTARIGPVAEFCAGLRQLRQASRYDQVALARRLNISRTQLYAILNGEVRRPPDWARFVGPLVEACTGGDVRVVAEWRRRHAVLVSVCEELSRQQRQAQASGAAAPAQVLPADLSVPAGNERELAQVIPAAGLTARHTLPRDIASFTGRERELQQLADLAAQAAGSGAAAGIYAIGGMAGVGKTAFAVHAAHGLAAQFPDGQIFLPLHAHTAGQQPADPAGALAGLLMTAGVAASQIPPGLEARSRLWRDRLAGQRLLMVLDDAAGHEQVRPLLPGTAGSLVVITSRRHLTALEDVQAVSLDTLPPADAAELLVRLAARSGLERDEAAVSTITSLCGHLPLAIGMLARQLHHHAAWTAAGLAADLAAARHRLEFIYAEDLSVAAAFDLTYRDLTAAEQRLFRRLGLHPGAEVDAYAAAALGDTGLAAARRHLEGLYDRYLLIEAVQGRYHFHDLIREHARTRAEDDPASDRDAATGHLMDYYLHTARVAGRHFARRPPASALPVTGIPPVCAPDLTARDQAVSWMNAERLNLHAAARYASAHNLPRYATAIAATMHGFLRIQGHWDQALSLHQTALGAARAARDQHAGAGALADLGDAQYLAGAYASAAASFARALEHYHRIGDRLGEASALSSLGVVQDSTGDYQAAAASQERSLSLYRDLGHRLGEATALNRLGWSRSATGGQPQAMACQEHALTLYRQAGDRLGEATALASLGQLQAATGAYQAARTSLSRAQALFRQLGCPVQETNILKNIGDLQSALGDYPAAAASLVTALGGYRDLGSRLGEQWALTALGVVQHRTGDYRAAATSLSRALTLSQDLSRRPDQARILNTIGDLLLASATPAAALDRYEQARAIATTIGLLAEQARALEGIGQCHLQDHQVSDGTAALRQALAIYHQIGSPDTKRVQKTLTDRDI